MAPAMAKTLMKDFRASFRRKKVESTPKIDKVKELEKDELVKLSKLKEILGENRCSLYKDMELLAFIRARSHDVKEAEKLINVDFNLRKFLKLEDFIKNHELSELNKKYSVSGVIGFDKEGSLIRVINIGYSDIKGYIHSISTIENFKLFLLYLGRDLKMLEEEAKRTGRKNTQMTFIVNMENLSLSKVMYKPVLDTAFVALKLLQDHFHDTVKVAYIINAPSFYSTLLKLFKPAIQDDLYKKIKIYDEGESCKAELLKLIDADVLPKCFGGDRVDDDGDEKCRSIMSWGGSIPESFYSTEQMNAKDPETICATVPAGAAVNYRFYAGKAGSRLKWKVQAKENDIGIGLFLDDHVSDEDRQPRKKKKKPAKDVDVAQLTQLTPVIRSQCHICPEIGDTITWFTGTLVVHLDNTYSWMNSKEVLLKISIELNN